MPNVIEFTCPICGSLCQTTDDKRGGHFQCMMCMSKVMVPQPQDDADGMDIAYFLQKGVVTQRLKPNTPGGPAGDKPKK